jgi:GNAT superfamily N-acetyltransferase
MDKLAARRGSEQANAMNGVPFVPNGYFIRPAQGQDLALLPALERAATQRFLETEYAILAQDDGYDEDIYRDWFEHGAILVAERAGELVGFAAAEVVDGQGFYALLCVHPAHAHRGLGRALTEAIKAWCVTRGHTTLTMTTFPHIPWNAPIFERMGFRIMEERELTPGLLALRREEAESGLAPEERVFMTIALKPA